jgi:ribose-phosphate pyrophosphokinase
VTPLIFPTEMGLPLVEPLSRSLGAVVGLLEVRRFPDGESYLRVKDQVKDQPCIILANLSHPDEKFLPLLFLASTLKELGARSVGLVAPYLTYMRQDRRFHDGESVTSRIFAQVLSQYVDWLITVDPHLHRYHDLSEIYSVPTTAVHGAPLLGEWLLDQKEEIVLVGPDEESEQWVAAIAEQTGFPYIVGKKERHGDRDVTVTLPDVSHYVSRTAVIVDDVVASGHTLLETVSVLQSAGFRNIDCATIHGIFVDGIDLRLKEKGLRKIISSNSIPHASNAIDLSSILVAPIKAHISADRNRSSDGVNNK